MRIEDVVTNEDIRRRRVTSFKSNFLERRMIGDGK